MCPNGDGRTVRAFFKKEGEAKTHVLPDSFAATQGTMPQLLVVGLDQGSKGSAGMAFAVLYLSLVCYIRWDKFHRIVRDLKLSIEHCCGGIFLKTQLYTSYIWSVNYKPLPALGNYGTVKKCILDSFLSPARHTIKSDLFRKYGPRIVSNFNQKPPEGSAFVAP